MKEPFNRWAAKVKIGLKDECWEWVGATTRGGYGHFRLFVDGEWKMYKSHRFSYEFHNDVKLSKDMLVCHACDNPKCANPKHLFVGSVYDNIADRVKKGRSGYGRKPGNSWLSMEIARAIREEYAKGEKTLEEVGKMFNTGKTQVHRIVKNKIWKER